MFKKPGAQRKDKRNPMFGPAKVANNAQTGHFNGQPGKKKFNNCYPERNTYEEGESTLFSGFTLKK